MASRSRAVIATCALALIPIIGASAKQREQAGDFALYRGTAQIRSDVRLIGDNELQIVQYPMHGNSPITRYTSTEREPMHVVLVRDDFRSFSHVHPSEASSGTFRVRV